MQPNWQDRHVLDMLFAKAQHCTPALQLAETRVRIAQFLCPTGVQRQFTACANLAESWGFSSNARGWPKDKFVAEEDWTKRYSPRGVVRTDRSGFIIRKLAFYRLDQITKRRIVPRAFGGLGMLQEVFFGKGQIRGTIPTEIGRLQSLTTWEASDNKLSGPIPTEVGRLGSLQKLLLGGNTLSGPLPSEIGNCQSLQDLHLEGNKLTGSIPSELACCRKLSCCDLDGNGFTGEVPEVLSRLANVRFFCVDSPSVSWATDFPKRIKTIWDQGAWLRRAAKNFNADLSSFDEDDESDLEDEGSCYEESSTSHESSSDEEQDGEEGFE